MTSKTPQTREQLLRDPRRIADALTVPKRQRPSGAPTTTMVLTVQPSGVVALAIFENTKTGTPRKFGQLVTVAPWGDVLSLINPMDGCRVIVRTVGVTHCPHCGAQCPDGYTSTCGASDCQEASYHANAARNNRRRRQDGAR